MNIFEQYGIKEVADVTLYSIHKKKDGSGDLYYVPALYLDTLKISSVEKTAENVWAQGGLGNERLICWDYGKQINVTLEDALCTPASLGLCWGGVLSSDWKENEVRHNYGISIDDRNPVERLSRMEKVFYPRSDRNNSIISNLLPRRKEDPLDKELGLLLKSSVVDGTKANGMGYINNKSYSWNLAVESAVKSISVVPTSFFDVKGKRHRINNKHTINIIEPQSDDDCKYAVVYNISKKDIQNFGEPEGKIIINQTVENNDLMTLESIGFEIDDVFEKLIVDKFPLKKGNKIGTDISDYFTATNKVDWDRTEIIDDNTRIGQWAIKALLNDNNIYIMNNEKYSSKGSRILLLPISILVKQVGSNLEGKQWFTKFSGDYFLGVSGTYNELKKQFSARFYHMDFYKRRDTGDGFEQEFLYLNPSPPNISTISTPAIKKFFDDKIGEGRVTKNNDGEYTEINLTFNIEDGEYLKIQIDNNNDYFGLISIDGINYFEPFVPVNVEQFKDIDMWLRFNSINDMVYYLLTKYEDNIYEITPVDIISDKVEYELESDESLEGKSLTGKLWAYINPKTMSPYPDDYWFHRGEPYFIKSLTLAQKNKKLKSQRITVTAGQFPGMYMIVGETYIRSRETGEDQRMQIKFPLCKIKSNQNITLEAEGEPTVFTLEVEVASPVNKIMMELTSYEVGEKMIENEKGFIEVKDGSTEILSE